jgi:hypothetical protein
MNERDEMARLLPTSPPRELPQGCHQLHKEFMMTQIHTQMRRRRTRREVLIPVLGGLAALAITAVVIAGGSNTPAYAVTENADGTVTIKIHEARDAKGLQATLRERGYDVIVDYVPEDKRCMPQPRSNSWVPGVTLSRPQTGEAEAGGAGFRVDLARLKPGQTAVLEFLVQGDHSAGISDRVSAGPVSECTLVDRATPRRTS